MESLAGRIMLMSGWKRALTAVFAGASGVLALPPFGFFAAMFVSFTLLVLLLDGASGNPDRGWLVRLLPAFMVGWLFGLGYMVGGLWWIGNALLVEADDYGWAVPLASIGLPALLALFYGLAGAISRIFWHDGFGRIAGLAIAIGLAEWLRSFIFSGFPWNAVGQGLMPIPLMMQSVKLVSTHGMNVIAVLIFATPAIIITKKGMRAGLSVALLLLAGHLGFGAWELRKADDLPAGDGPLVRLVQPMIDQSRKISDADRNAIFEDHLALTAQAPENGGKRPDYVIWPETSVPFILTQNPQALSRIAEVLQEGQILIAGAVRAEETGGAGSPRYYNSVYMIDDKGQIIGAYDKVHLVPFGEYLPFETLLDQAGLKAVAAMPGGFSAAPDHRLLETPGGRKFYPLICYEIIFSNAIQPIATSADAIVNITNDGWFGDTPGPWQHFFQARLRAVETGLPVIRDSNSGISAIISPTGEFSDGLGFGMRGVLDLHLPPKIASVLDADQRAVSFWILQILAFLIAIYARVSFILFGN